MLATAIYVAKTIVRACKKIGRGISLVVEAYGDARDLRRTASGRYPHMED